MDQHFYIILIAFSLLVIISYVFSLISKKFKPPYGIVAHNDLIAIGAMHSLIEKKIKIPQQVGIVGYDDIALSAYVTPGLTTINQNQYDADQYHRAE